MNNDAILVLGMHRSGTSALAGVLSQLGVSFGDKLIPAIEGVNEKGFFEHTDLVAANEAVLDTLGRSWLNLDAMPYLWWQQEALKELSSEITAVLQRDFEEKDVWGLKDPRLCRLMPLWKQLLIEAGVESRVILCFRHPLEVAGSLCRRDGLDFNLAIVMWFQHVLECERDTRGMRRSQMCYEALLADWQAEFSRVGGELEFDWPVSLEVAGPQVDDFLEQDLRHVRVGQVDSTGSLVELAVQFYEQIKSQSNLDQEMFVSYAHKFEAEISGLSAYLPILNAAQLAMYQSTALKRELHTEQSNAREQIEYRDDFISNLQSQRKLEQENAAEQIKYRDDLIEGLNEQLSSERKNTVEQIEYREALLAEIRQQLADEKQNAEEQITYRDQQITDRDNLLASRKHLLKTLIKHSLPGKS
ncbi:MAG: hypothetical protein V7742_17880 [Halioglobus sp.]